MSVFQRVVRRPDTTLVTFGGAPERTFKLSQRHVLQVEQQAGRALEFLSERELAATVQFLGIKPLALDATDQALLASIRQQAAAAAPASPQPVQRPPVMTPPAPPMATDAQVDTAYPDTQESSLARWRMVAGLLAIAIVIIGIVLVLLFLIRTGGGSNGDGGTATPAGTATVTAINNTLVFAGPGNQYPTVGTLLANQSAPILGVSPDQQWWLIEFPTAPDEQGWVAAAMVRTRGAETVPIVTPPPLATPTATLTATPLPATPTLAPPAALIDGPTQAQVGQQILFDGRRSTASPGATITRYGWDFGDGSTASGSAVTKTYERAGVYNVQLTVIDDKGQSSQAVQQVVVADAATATPTLTPTTTPTPAPPTAVIAGPSQAFTGQRVVFDASRSTGVNPLIGYFWDFGDGSTGNGLRVDHVFAQPGFYSVILTVQDSLGLTGSASLTVQIAEPATPTPPPSLENVTWQLENTLPATRIVAIFRSGQVSGFSGCNDYTGSYVIDGQALAVSGLTSTQQSCAAEVMQQEQVYLASLAAAQSYQVANGRLVIAVSGENQQGSLSYILTP
jgi:heat shock protein HslJ